MDEPTALMPPVSTSSLAELLEDGPLPLQKGLELLGVIAGQLAKVHDRARTHGLLTSSQIRVSLYENGPPVVILLEPESTRDSSEGADQLALGVLVFEVLAGREPEGNEVLSAAVPEAPAALDRLVAKLLAPRPVDRLTAAGAHRQLTDLAQSLGDPTSKAVSPLAAPPQIKRGVPIGASKTDAHAWVQKQQTDPAAKVTTDPEGKNPFADDERTATGPDPRVGPAMEDEPTQFAPRPPGAQGKSAKRQRATEVVNEPLPPPVPTPSGDSPGVAEPTRTGFEPSRSDLPGKSGDGEEEELMTDPKHLPKRVPQPLSRRREGKRSAMSEIMRIGKKQPAWVWGVVGVGVAFFVLLLIALAR
ncbi:MAG: hypothetical protein JNK82_31110 [Myxococcaceae bacterium]|nr:hypothetical protein [Myxococcaceae bacterium]